MPELEASETNRALLVIYGENKEQRKDFSHDYTVWELLYVTPKITGYLPMNEYGNWKDQRMQISSQ